MTSLYITTREAAQALGKSYDWFCRKRPDLEVAGFPRKDPITNGYIRADVDAWVEKRRQITDNSDPLSPQEEFNDERL